MRAWLCSRIGSVDNRVYFAVPEQDAPTLPFLVFYRVGGLPDNQQHDNPDYVIECWGATKKAAADLATEVAGAVLDATHEAPTYVEGAVVMSSGVNGLAPSTGTPRAKRYRVDASMRMRRSSII